MQNGKKVHSGQQWTRTTPVKTDFTDRLPYPNDFCYPIVVLLEGIEPPFHPYQRCVLTILL
jgi:hypothetical protein